MTIQKSKEHCWPVFRCMFLLCVLLEGVKMVKITKDAMEQYETIRQSGACNMFDYYCVQNTASKMEMYALASLDRDDYKVLLRNFNKLMKKYDIKQ